MKVVAFCQSNFDKTNIITQLTIWHVAICSIDFERNAVEGAHKVSQ